MSERISFLLGQHARHVSDVSPTTTVLQYLRGQERRCGTKEGCAEGDCGACTVVLGEVKDGGMVYRAVNSCIQFVPTLNGKQLITVEDLRDPSGALHPVQHAMAYCNGSQCGFCTPGFVMSLFAAYANGLKLTPESLDDILSGNLCRCTGYGPIIEAALSLGDAVEPDHFKQREPATVRQLLDLSDDHEVGIARQDEKFFAPTTVDELARLYLEHPDATILAGGTDVGLWVTKLHKRLPVIISILSVADLRGIREADGVLEFEAGVTLNEAALALKRIPGMGLLMRRFASAQIRNIGTLCGNVANGSPIGDLPPALLALGAEIVLRKGGARRVLPLEKFFLDYRKQDREPGEFVQAVRVPLLKSGEHFNVHKVTKRLDEDISAVCAAHFVEVGNGVIRQARLAYGGMAAIPKRAVAAERAMIGKIWNEETLAAAQEAIAADFTPLSDMRATAAYRMTVAKNLLRRTFLEMSGAADTRVPYEWSLAHE